MYFDLLRVISSKLIFLFMFVNFLLLTLNFYHLFYFVLLTILDKLFKNKRITRAVWRARYAYRTVSNSVRTDKKVYFVKPIMKQEIPHACQGYDSARN